MEACSSEQSVWAQRKGWEELELTFQVKKEKQTNKKFLWPLFIPHTERSAVRCDCCWDSRLLFRLDIQSVLWTSRIQREAVASPSCPWLLRGSAGHSCTDGLCCCSCECGATEEDSQWCQTATSGHKMISWSLSTAAGLCHDVALVQGRSDTRWQYPQKIALTSPLGSPRVRLAANGCHLATTMARPYMATTRPATMPTCPSCCTSALQGSCKGWSLSPESDGPSLGVTMPGPWACRDACVGLTKWAEGCPGWGSSLRFWMGWINLQAGKGQISLPELKSSYYPGDLNPREKYCMKHVSTFWGGGTMNNRLHRHLCQR